jgi:hypothetical protein
LISTCAQRARSWVALAIVSGQWACVSARNAADSPASTPSAVESPAPKPSTLAEASAACDRVQANTELPVSCTTDYVESVPSIIVGFRNPEEAQQWLGPFAEQIGGPFCDAANRNGREARVYMTVGTNEQQRARMWSCELGKWSDWFATTASENAAAPAPPAPRETISDAIRACSDVQANRDLPVTCQTQSVDGVASMIVGFRTPDEAEAYMKQVAEQVAMPFCNAANRANRPASLFITLANAQARHYDCEQQTWSDWFELPQRKAANRNTL